MMEPAKKPHLTAVNMTAKPEGNEARPMVAHDDHIYFSTDNGAHHGKVVAVGEHGCTCRDDEDAEHKVLWDKVLGHKKRADKKLVIVDKGEDGFIAKNEAGKMVFVRGQVGEEEGEETTAPPPVEESKLQKARVIAELAKAGFEPMVDYVRSEFGDNFVYKASVESSTVEVTELRKSFDQMISASSAQSQGLSAAIGMIAERMESYEMLTKSLMVALTEARKPQEISLTLTLPDKKPVAMRAVRGADGSMMMTPVEVPRAE